MKCLRCGKEIPEDKSVCENCGYNTKESDNLEKVYVEVDPDIEDNKRVTLIDTPILTFVFGLLSVICSLLIAFSGKPIPLILIGIFIILFAVTFYLSTRPCRIGLKPVREVGIILGFIAFVISAYCISMWLLEITSVI